jgi:hypothetical protein
MKHIVNFITYITVVMALIGATRVVNIWFGLDLEPFDAIACAALAMAIKYHRRQIMLVTASYYKTWRFHIWQHDLTHLRMFHFRVGPWWICFIFRKGSDD